MNEIEGHPYWELSFDKSGGLTSPAEGQFLSEVAASGITDLFVMSHGWGNDQAAARRLYEAMFPLVAAAASQAQGIGPFGFAGLFWPSLWFPDPPPEAAAQVAAEVAADRPGAANAALSGQQITETLKASFDDTGQQAKLDQMGKLIDAGTAGVGSEPDAIQQERLAQFHQLLQALVPASPQAVEDSGETALLAADDPGQAYADISDIVGSAPPSGDAQGIGDVFGKIWNGAKDALRIASYYEMKARAGAIGRNGLGPLLEHLHDRHLGIRVHLIGHSFGARLVSFALSGITSPQASPVASLCLLQGAFSHWSFAHLQDMPFGTAGALNQYADRVHGPLLATFSEHDWAVGRWYPKASFLAQQDAEADTDPASQWGGMGSDGYQGVAPASSLDLAEAGKPYALKLGTFYRVDGSAVIADTTQSAFSGAHSDIRHPQIAWLIASAAVAEAA
jgi:hypothetical protein